MVLRNHPLYRGPAVVAATLAAVVACVLAFVPPALADTFPAKPAKLVVPFPPGGPLDATGRAIAQKLTEAWGQSVIVENKPGAGGNIGADYVAKSPADGYTIVMGALSTHAVNPSLYPKMPYDAKKDFAPISLVAVTPNVLVVNPALPMLPEPNDSLPGFAFAYAINSCTECTGSAGLTTSTFGVTATSEIGAKSFFAS